LALVRTNRRSQLVVESPTVNISVDFDAFTPSANSIVVVVMGCINDGGRVDTGGLAVTGGGLTWTRQLQVGVEASGWSQTFEVWTAPVGSSPPSVALNVAGAIASGSYAAHVHVNAFDFTGYDTSSPIGTKKIVSGAGTEYGAYSMTLDAAPASSSIVLAGRYCSTSGGNPTNATVGSGWTELYDYGTDTSGQGDLQTQERTGSTSTSVAWADTVETADANYPGLWIQFAAIEIKEASTGASCAPGAARASRAIGALSSTSSSNSSPGTARVPRRVPSPTVYTQAFANSAQLPAIRRRAPGSMQVAQTSVAAPAPPRRERRMGPATAAVSGVPNSIAHPVVRFRTAPQGVGEPPVALGASVYAYSHWPEPTGILTSSAITTVSGSMLIARVSNWYAATYNTMRGISDSKGNVWTTLEQAWITSDEWEDSTSILYQAATNLRGSGHTFTNSYRENSETTFSVVELLNCSGMHDIRHTAYGYQYGTVFASESITVPRRALLLCWLELNWYVTAPTTATAGWTMVHEYQADDSSMHEALFYRVVEAGTYSCTLTITGIAQGGGVTIAAFVGDNPSIGATSQSASASRIGGGESVGASLVSPQSRVVRRLGPVSAAVGVIVDTAPQPARRSRSVGMQAAGLGVTPVASRRDRRSVSSMADVALAHAPVGRRRAADPSLAGIGSALTPVARPRVTPFGSLGAGINPASATPRRAAGGIQSVLFGAWWPASQHRATQAPTAIVGSLVATVLVPVVRRRVTGAIGVAASSAHASPPVARYRSVNAWSAATSAVASPVVASRGVPAPSASVVSLASVATSSARRTRATGEIAVEMASLASVSSAVRFRLASPPGANSMYFGPFAGATVIGHLYSSTATTIGHLYSGATRIT
jgi:hypothetical protein